MVPRLDLLHSFFVVARAGSMKAAAAELGVTAGAISQRIRELETRCGHRLLDRGRTGTTPSAAGTALLDEIGDAFRRLEEAAARHLDPSAGAGLRISSAPAFASAWLIPRLGRFTAAHPGVPVAIETEARIVDLRREPVDLAIRHGLGRYPGLVAHWLASPRMVVVGSPELVARHGPVERPADCLRFTLLQDQDRQDWRLWFAALGVDAAGTRSGPALSDDHLLVRAACQGQGLALVRDLSVAEEVAAGRLLCLLGASWPSEFAYYLVGLPPTFERPAARSFTRWLKSEVADVV